MKTYTHQSVCASGQFLPKDLTAEMFQDQCARSGIGIMPELLDRLNWIIYQINTAHLSSIQYGMFRVGNLFPDLHRSDPEAVYRFEKPETIVPEDLEELCRTCIDDRVLQWTLQKIWKKEGAQSLTFSKVTRELIEREVDRVGARPFTQAEALSYVLSAEYPRPDFDKLVVNPETHWWRRVLQEPFEVYGRPLQLCYGIRFHDRPNAPRSVTKWIGLNGGEQNLGWTNDETFACALCT